MCKRARASTAARMIRVDGEGQRACVDGAGRDGESDTMVAASRRWNTMVDSVASCTGLEVMIKCVLFQNVFSCRKCFLVECVLSLLENVLSYEPQEKGPYVDM